MPHKVCCALLHSHSANQNATALPYSLLLTLICLPSFSQILFHILLIVWLQVKDNKSYSTASSDPVQPLFFWPVCL